MAKLGRRAGTRWVTTIDTALAEAVREAVKQQRDTLSGFTQAALANHLRNHRPVMEYVEEGRNRKGRSPAPGGLDSTLDRPDGIPHSHTEWAPADWKDYWRLSTKTVILDELNTIRASDGRTAVSDAEWKAIVRHMGREPGGTSGT